MIAVHLQMEFNAPTETVFDLLADHTKHPQWDPHMIEASLFYEGTGDIELAGTVEKQELELTGTGDYKAPDLESRAATVRIDGTSKAQLWVLDSLDVVINGVGGVNYFGSPNVTQSITGNESLTSLGDK